MFLQLVGHACHRLLVGWAGRRGCVHSPALPQAETCPLPPSLATPPPTPAPGQRGSGSPWWAGNSLSFQPRQDSLQARPQGSAGQSFSRCLLTNGGDLGSSVGVVCGLSPQKWVRNELLFQQELGKTSHCNPLPATGTDQIMKSHS